MAGARGGSTSSRRIAAVLVVAAAVSGAVGAGPQSDAIAATDGSHPKASGHPNIVFVLADDLSWNLLQYMPHVRRMRTRGATFTRYFVTDSLCCPSRASILTGRLPHNTGVFTNIAPDGGFGLFRDNGQEADTFATAISSIPGAHYRTAMMGKYLNGYQPSTLYVPPGWSEWDVAGNGYAGFNYTLNENGKLVSYWSTPDDYLTDVLAGKGVGFINRSVRARDPFLLEIATFAPHSPFTPAPRDAGDYPGLQAPRTPAFDAANASAPQWLAGRPPLKAGQIARLDEHFRARAQAVEAIDDLVGRLERTLRARGVADNTYLVFSSDNGFHMGDHRLMQGKMTAFDTDIGVPLIVVGPGIPAGRTVGRLAENIDLRPTFSRLTGAPVPDDVDGRSLVPLLRGRPVAAWRTAALIEHHGPDQSQSDPDYQPPASGNPTSYEAIRKPSSLYVEYRNGDREYYDLATDPYELDNRYGDFGLGKRERLHEQLARLEACSGRSCRVAGG